MATESETITLTLPTTAALFDDPTADPWDPAARYRSGIDEVWAELDSRPVSEATTLSIRLPATESTPDLEARIRAAIGRYATAIIEEKEDELRATSLEARRNFLISILVTALLFGLIGLLIYFLAIEGALQTALIGWGGIAAWAILWNPVDTFVWGRRSARRQVNLARKLARMPVRVVPAE